MDPEVPEPGEQDRSPLKTTLRDNRASVVIVGGVALVVVVAILGNLGNDSPEAAPTPTPLAALPTTTRPADVEGHQIPPLDGCTLIPTDDVAVALGLPDDVGLIQTSGREACVWQPPEDGPAGQGRSVELKPGSPEDFGSGATVDAVIGVPVPGVGDSAMWFGADDTGTLSVVKAIDQVYLFMRLAISRPDVTDQDRLDLATGLVTSAIDMVVMGPPKPIDVDLCDLVTDEEAETLLAPHREGRAAAMDHVIVSDNFGENVDLSQSGDFECTKLILTEIYIKVETATESDFGDSANIEGVPGVSLTGIGDAAVWFEDVPAGGGFASPHETDVISVAWGNARFRIAMALPDLGRDEQFDTARDLARKALGRLPGGPITVEPETPDFSNLGFVDNLLAREEAGEWTFENGLIATLQLFAGEINEDQVLVHPDLVDYSGTGVIAMAEEYLDTIDGGSAKDEVARLLDVLIPQFDSVPTPEVSKSLTVSLGDFFLAPFAQRGPADGERKGYAPPADDVPFDYPTPPQEPGECATFEPTLAGWDISGYELEGYGAWAAAVLFPSPGQEDGWGRETHLNWALQALTDSIAEYGTPPVCIRLLLSHHGGSYTFVEQRIDPSLCLVFINKPMQGRDTDAFRQQLAADIAHCYIPFVFPSQFDATYLTRRWWNHALAEFLSNVVYPSANLEWRLAPSMAAQETTRPLVERDAGNWMFFQGVSNALGNEEVAAIIQALPGGDNRFLDQLAVAGLPQMNQVYHTFSEQMTDASVSDSGGGPIPYQPPKAAKSIDGPGTHEQQLTPFQVTRWQISVPSGQYACITGQTSGDALVSYRVGRVGTAAGEWTELPEVETPFNGDFVVVATAVDEGQGFSLKVRDVGEESDCEDEKETLNEPPPDTCECDPSDYFLVWQDIPELLQKVLNPSR
jgi:hypothetical protein